MAKVIKAFDRIDKATVWLGMGIVVILMVANSMDATLRYSINRPLTGVFELSELLIAGLIFLQFSAVQAQGRHISVTILIDHLPARVRTSSKILGLVVGIGIMVIIVWQSSEAALTSFQRGYTSSGAVPIPQWPFEAMVPLGGLLLGIRFLIDLGRQIKRFPAPEAVETSALDSVETSG